MRDMFKIKPPRKLTVKTEFFGSLFSSSSKDLYYGNKPDLDYSYLGLMLFYHFRKKETLTKIANFYSTVGKDILDVVKRIPATGEYVDDRLMSEKDKTFLISCANGKWQQMAKALHNYHTTELKKFGINFTLKDMYILSCGAAGPSFVYCYGITQKSDDTDWSKYKLPVNCLEDNSVELQKTKYLNELKNNLDKLVINAREKYMKQATNDFYTCQYKYYEDDDNGFEYTDTNEYAVDAFYPISDQGEYGPGEIWTVKEEDKKNKLIVIEQLTDLQKQYIIKQIDKLLIPLQQ